MQSESIDEIAAWVPDEETTSFVYFLRNQSSGAIKIGCSICPPKRRLAVKSEAQADMETIKIIRGSRITESYLHNKLSQHRIKGEWYRPEPEIFRLISMLTPASSAAIQKAHEDYRTSKRNYNAMQQRRFSQPQNNNEERA